VVEFLTKTSLVDVEADVGRVVKFRVEADNVFSTLVSPDTVNNEPLYVKPDCAIAPFGVPSDVSTLVSDGS